MRIRCNSLFIIATPDTQVREWGNKIAKGIRPMKYVLKARLLLYEVGVHIIENLWDLV